MEENKYLFSNKNHKPICISYYESDEIAIQQAAELANEKGYPVNVSRLLTTSAMQPASQPAAKGEQ